MQTWRFEIIDSRRLVIHGWDTRDHCIYDLEGNASHLALGALLANLRLAATHEGLAASITRRGCATDANLTFDVSLSLDTSIRPDPLVTSIERRAVQRRPMSTRPLTAEQKLAMTAALGSDYSAVWMEDSGQRLRMARVIFESAKVRLTTPEAYPTHASVIEWNAQFSETKIPDQAVGLDPVTTAISRWALVSWARVDFMNRYLGGTFLPRIQLDLIGSIRCASHFLIVANKPPSSVDDFIDAGAAWMRFWLTATQFGLWQQPEMTPLIFARYVRRGVQFTTHQPAVQLAARVRSQLIKIFSEDIVDRAVVLGRIGTGPSPKSRSLRLPLDKLIVAAAPTGKVDS